VVAKHRRSEEPSLASAGARMSTAEYWPEEAGYDRAVAAARPGTGPRESRYPGSIDYNNGSDGPDGQSWPEWEEWQDRQDWGPPPALHPDHPSAPVPRVQLPADHPSGPMPAFRGPAGPGRAGPRRSVPPPRGAGRMRSPGRHDSVTTSATVGYLTVHHEVSSFRRGPGGAGRHATDYQRQAGPGGQHFTRYRDDAGPYGPGPGPATDSLEDESSPDSDPLWMAGQVLTLADDKAASLARDAQDEAAAIREAAEREASAIREAAVQEAAELRARLNSMLGELSRITAYLTESIADPAMAAIAPAMAAAAPAIAPSLPGAGPAIGVASPARPATRPAGPGVRPAVKPAGRQAKTMRKFMAAFAVVSVLGAVAGGGELVRHGLPFFLFRANGAGASEVGQKEPSIAPRAGQPFLQGQQSAAHHKPGAHRKPAAPQPTTTTR